MPYAIRIEGVWTRAGAPLRVGDVVHPAGVDGMSPEELTAAGAVWYEPAGPAPNGQIVVETYLTDQGGAPVEKNLLEPIPLEQRKATTLAAIDAERDRRQQLDFAYDFGETLAINPAKETVSAGVKALQMRFDPDQRNWMGLQSQAVVAVISGMPDALAPMRAEDNFNVQTTAQQVLVVTAAMVARNGAILFHGGDLKDQVRAAANGSALDAINITIGWPG